MADEMTFKHVLPVQIRFNDVDQYGHCLLYTSPSPRDTR